MTAHRYDEDRKRQAFRLMVEQKLVEAGATPPLQLLAWPAPRWLTFMDATGRRAMWSYQPYIERATGPALLSRAQHIRGMFRGWEGDVVHFVESYPRRRVHSLEAEPAPEDRWPEKRGRGNFGCDVCGLSYPQWFTDDDTWDKLPEKWRGKVLCVPCFVEMVPQ